MNFSKYLWGLILIIVGVLLLFSNFNWIDVDWRFLMKLWPLLFILWGISYLPRKFQAVAAVICTLLIAVILYYALDRGTSDWLFEQKNNGEASTEEMWNMDDKVISEPYNMQLDHARLNLEASAGKFILDETTDELIQINPKGNWGEFNMKRKTVGDTDEVTLKLRRKNVKLNKITSNDKVYLRLNTQPVWAFDFDFGAAETNMDLSMYKITRMKIKAGAADVDIKLGAHLPESKVTLDAGASSVTLRIPESAGCKIKAETGLASKSFDNFSKTGDNTYQTPGFDSAHKQIFITMDAGVSSLKVERY